MREGIETTGLMRMVPVINPLNMINQHRIQLIFYLISKVLEREQFFSDESEVNSNVETSTRLR